MSEYPVEQYSMVLALLNPVDMCRILVMFSFDISALMGLTGTVLQNWLGTAGGQAVIYASLMLWILVPFLIARRIFLTKDF
jgi:Cu-processing system permease protein